MYTQTTNTSTAVCVYIHTHIHTVYIHTYIHALYIHSVCMNIEIKSRKCRLPIYQYEWEFLEDVEWKMADRGWREKMKG